MPRIICLELYIKLHNQNKGVVKFMKKILVLMMVLLLVSSCTVFAAEGYFNAKLGLDLAGNHDVDYEEGGSGDFDVDTGFTIAGEYLVPYNAKVDFGAGLAYQFERGIDEKDIDNDIKFSFIPLYGIMKYKLDKAYLLGQLGYNFFDPSKEYEYGGDAEGGLYYGLGAGMNFSENIFAEILYSVNKGEINYDEDDDFGFEVDNSQISLMLGYKF